MAIKLRNDEIKITVIASIESNRGTVIKAPKLAPIRSEAYILPRILGNLVKHIDIHTPPKKKGRDSIRKVKVVWNNPTPVRRGKKGEDRKNKIEKTIDIDWRRELVKRKKSSIL